MGLDLSLTLLVLASAVMHATWNAMVKVEQDRLVAFALLHGTGVVLGTLLVILAPPLHAEAWWYLAPSIVLQAGYIGVLMLAYQAGDLSQVYPVARGSAPLGVVLLGSLAGNRLPFLEIAGVAVISVAILSLAWRSGSAPGQAAQHRRAVGYALLLGLNIAAYTVVDSYGVRASDSPLAYGGWIFILYGIPWLTLALIRRRDALRHLERRHGVLALGAGGLCFASYVMVVWALRSGAAAPVSALRECSVIFAALIGTVLLKEPFGLRRVAAALLVAVGVILIRLA